MLYCQIYLRNIKGLFTWETDLEVEEGSLVEVPFRRHKRVGVVTAITKKKPEFKTQKILSIWEKEFLPKESIELARYMGQRYYSSLEKVMSLMIPEKFHRIQNPVKREEFIYLNSNFAETLSGQKQKKIIALLQEAPNNTLPLKMLRDEYSPAVLKRLIERNCLILKTGRISGSNQHSTDQLVPLKKLTDLQEKAFVQIQSTSKPSLLFGVTGSGKTEVYKHVIEDLKKEEQCLFLVPEIALTPQLIRNLVGTFGREIELWHSNCSEGEKIQAWGRIKTGDAKILVGTRSALLVPFKDLRLVVMDEEHEWTYKNEFVPRFWSHEIIDYWVQERGVKWLMGSATPRIESLYYSKTNKWDLARLDQRVFEQKMPQISTVSLSNEAKKGNYSPLSEPLLKALKRTLDEERQSVLFLNKRGYAGATMCRHCGETFECPHCDHPMKMHQNKTRQSLVCHVCGHFEGFPSKCIKCNKSDFQFKGWGTQQVEEVLKEVLPRARVLRADRDAVSGRYDFEIILKKFEDHKADILLGTQMISKGLDLEKVDLVGIILADVGLNLPDFRVEERVFQLLMQVAGRAGRREKQGKIIIQTYDPDASIFEYLSQHEVERFLESQLEIRRETGFPPFGLITKITISHEKKEKAWIEGRRIYKNLKDTLELTDNDVKIFFAPAFFPRTHGKYHFHVIIQSQNRFVIKNDQMNQWENIESKVSIDENPASLL